MDLVSWTFSSASPDLEKPLLVDPSKPSRSLSYNELRSYVRRIVSGLHRIGVRPGDCVCVNSFNDLFYTSLYLGIMGSGAIFTGVNPAYTTQELIHHFKLTKPKVIVVEPYLAKQTLEAADKVGLPRSRIYLFDVYDVEEKAVDPSLASWQRLLEYGERDWVAIDDPDRVVAQYAQTSGTTGFPKAAMLSHSYHVSQAALRLSPRTLPYTPRRLIALPPFHVFATPICPSSIREGVVTYVMRRFEMRSFLSFVKQFDISETYLAPPVLVGMPLSPFSTKKCLRSLRQIWFGGASLRYKNQLPIYELLHPDAKIQPVWGMTEAGWITAGSWPDKHTDDSSGRALPGFEVKIVDDYGHALIEKGAIGDILVKSPAMMLGYIDNEQATREAFDSDGWLRTGDVGQLTEGDKVFVIDRKKDLMKVRGWQVSPVEVESVLLQHPDIVDAGVVGIPLANNTGEIPRAYIVLRAETILSDEEVKKFAARSLAKYKVPVEIVFLDQIPKNPTGKVLRRTLRERAIGSIKRETSSRSIEQDTANGQWRYIRTLSYPVTQGTKQLYRFLS